MEGADGSGWVEVCDTEHVYAWGAVGLREVHAAEFSASYETNKDGVIGGGTSEELHVKGRHRGGIGVVAHQAGLGILNA